jgi:group I intron endonuclease
MSTGVYKITNKLNGKVYIGSSTNLEQRKMDHFKPSTLVSHRSHLPLYQDIKCYGVENFNFEVIEYCKEDELVQREDFYLSKVQGSDCYNSVYKSITMHDEEFSEANSRRLTEMNKRKWKDPEYRRQRSETSKAYQATVPYEERAKSIEGLNKYTNSIKLPVGQYDKEGNLIATFEGVREAERAMNLPNDTIGKVCRGVKYRKTAAGFVWKYLDK